MSEDQTDGSPVLPEVTESKVEAAYRLQKEARWEEASRYRHAVRRRLHSEGKNKNEANEMAWSAMILAFPPIEPEGDAPTTEFNAETTLRKGVICCSNCGAVFSELDLVPF